MWPPDRRGPLGLAVGRGHFEGAADFQPQRAFQRRWKMPKTYCPNIPTYYCTTEILKT
jgi:hypothetical protein